MKRSFIFSLTLVICFMAFGQQSDPRVGFTYQALAIDRTQSEGFGRDTQGKVLANQDVILRFNILEGANGEIRYQEIHNTSTDAFGIFRLIIGRGESSSDILLEELYWGQTAYFLEIEIDLGDGFQALGVEELHGAPFALNTLPQKLKLNENELSISQGNMIKLDDNDPSNELIERVELVGSSLQVVDAGGTRTVDLSGLTDADPSPTNELQDISTSGTPGNISIENGSTIALNVDDSDADASNEIQDLSLTGNILSITNNTSATPIDLSGLGAGGGAFSTATNVTSNSPGDFENDDFVFGSPQLDDDGDPDHQARMFFDKSKGAFRAGSSTGDQWDDAKVGAGSIALGRDIEAQGQSSVALGFDSKALGDVSTVIGFENEASGFASVSIGRSAISDGSVSIGDNVTSIGSGIAIGGASNAGISSVALGVGNDASGFRSLAVGVSNNASGLDATSLGYNSAASGQQSLAIGWTAIASGNASTAMGFSTQARSAAETAIGVYNTDYMPISTTDFELNDKLFVVGNGPNDGNRSDALVILKNGDATLSGTLTELSDKRLKKDISPIKESLRNLNDLDGVHYKWNSIKPHDTISLQTGFIAQDLEKHFPELVKEDAEGYKSVNYIGLIPHLVEAIKELKSENEDLKDELAQKKRAQSIKLDELETRLRMLENQSRSTKKKVASNRAKTRGN